MADIHELLKDAEAHASPMELDQIAWVLATLDRAEVLGHEKAYVGSLPKLKAQFDDCLKDLNEEHRGGRDKILAAGGFDPENPPKDRSKNVPLALLGLSRWMDREDRVGQVTTYFMRRLRSYA